MNILGLAFRDSLVAQTVKSLPEIQEIWDRSVGQEGLLEKETTTHSSILVQRIPMDERVWGTKRHRVTKNQIQPKGLNMQA